MLPFMVEQIFLLMGEVWSMHNDRYTVRGEEAKGREEFLCLNFSCLHNLTIVK